MGVQEIRWDKGGTVKSRGFFFFCGRGSKIHPLETGFFVKRVEFVSDRMSYIVLRGVLVSINIHNHNQLILNIFIYMVFLELFLVIHFAYIFNVCFGVKEGDLQLML